METRYGPPLLIRVFVLGQVLGAGFGLGSLWCEKFLGRKFGELATSLGLGVEEVRLRAGVGGTGLA